MSSPRRKLGLRESSTTSPRANTADPPTHVEMDASVIAAARESLLPADIELPLFESRKAAARPDLEQTDQKRNAKHDLPGTF
jgi:hypothetical protein